MPKLNSQSSGVAKVKRGLIAAIGPSIALSLLGGAGYGTYAWISSANSREDRNKQSLVDAFNEGQKRVMLENDNDVYGLVASRDSNGDIVLTAHRATEFDGSGDIKAMSGRVQLKTVMKKKAEQAPR